MDAKVVKLSDLAMPNAGSEDQQADESKHDKQGQDAQDNAFVLGDGKRHGL